MIFGQYALIASSIRGLLSYFSNNTVETLPFHVSLLVDFDRQLNSTHKKEHFS